MDHMTQIRQVEFPVDSEIVRGSLRLPEAAAPLPAVVMAHGWGMVAGGDLEDYAAVFNARGIATLSFDFRHLGISDGEPRQDIDPWRQIEDYRTAITYLETVPEID